MHLKSVGLLVLVAAAVAAGKDCHTKKSSSKLFCYYGKAKDIDSCKCSHIVLPADADVKAIEGLRDKLGATKILLTVNEFNEGLVTTLKNTKVDGLEINLKKLDSKNDIADFISTVRSKLGSDLYLALAVPPKTETLAKYYDFKALSKSVDVLILQTHLLGASKNVTFHPSRLSGLWDVQNTDSVVDLVSGLGAPLSKLVITAPVQGFKFTLQNDKHTAPGSPALELSTLTRDQLCEKMGSDKWMLERDQDQAGPYIFRDKEWVAFEDSMSMDIKAKYSRVRGLAGLALKDVSQDGGAKCGETLLEAAYSGLSKQARAPRGAVLHSLEREILQAPSKILDNVQVSPYRISRVIDVEGKVHVMRQDTRTEFKCSRQGYFVHPRSCGRFYRCVKFDQLSDEFSVFEFDCPAGLAFDERVEVCVWPGSLPHASACSGSSEIAPVPRERFICPGDQGYYADPENCRWFFACLDHGKSPLSAYEFRCPYGLVFDEERLMCEWPWMVPKCASGYASGSIHGEDYHYGGLHGSRAGAVALDVYDGLGSLNGIKLGGLSGTLVQPIQKTYSSFGTGRDIVANVFGVQQQTSAAHLGGFGTDVNAGFDSHKLAGAGVGQAFIGVGSGSHAFAGNSNSYGSGSYSGAHNSGISGSYAGEHASGINSGSYSGEHASGINSGSYSGEQASGVNSGSYSGQASAVNSGSYSGEQASGVSSGSYSGVNSGSNHGFGGSGIYIAGSGSQYGQSKSTLDDGSGTYRIDHSIGYHAGADSARYHLSGESGSYEAGNSGSYKADNSGSYNGGASESYTVGYEAGNTNLGSGQIISGSYNSVGSDQSGGYVGKSGIYSAGSGNSGDYAAGSGHLGTSGAYSVGSGSSGGYAAGSTIHSGSNSASGSGSYAIDKSGSYNADNSGAYVAGSGSYTADNSGAYIAGSGSYEAGNSGAYVAGSGSNKADNSGAYIVESGIHNLENSGAKVAGSGSYNTGNSGAYVEGSGSYKADNSGAYVAGSVSYNAENSGAYIAGSESNKPDNSGAYVAGSGGYKADNSGAHIAGSGSYNLDNSGAYVAGSDTYKADNSGAYVAGSGSYKADNSGAYVAGSVSYNAENSGAYIAGSESYKADNSGAYVAGSGSYKADNSGAHVAGSVSYNAENSGAYIAGSESYKADNSGAYVAGSGSYKADNSGAYVAGSGSYNVDNSGAYVAGSGSSKEENSGAYVAGSNSYNSATSGSYASGGAVSTSYHQSSTSDESGSYKADHSGNYIADNSGSYVADHSGSYNADNSGSYNSEVSHSGNSGSYAIEFGSSDKSRGSGSYQSSGSLEGVGHSTGSSYSSFSSGSNKGNSGAYNAAIKYGEKTNVGGSHTYRYSSQAGANAQFNAGSSSSGSYNLELSHGHEHGQLGQVNIIAGGSSGVGVAKGVQITQHGVNLGVTPLPTIPSVTSVPLPSSSGFEFFNGGVVANIPDLQFKLEHPSTINAYLGNFESHKQQTAKDLGFANYTQFVSSTHAPLVLKSDVISSGFNIAKVDAYKSVGQVVGHNGGYVYPKPSVKFEETLTYLPPAPSTYLPPAPVTYLPPVQSTYLPAVSSTPATYLPPVSPTVYLLPSTTPKPTAAVYLPPAPSTYLPPKSGSYSYSQRTAHKSSYVLPSKPAAGLKLGVIESHSFHNRNRGYQYTKPTIAFEEKPVTIIQEVKPAVTFHESKSEGYHYEKPTIAFVEKPQPAVAYQEIKHHVQPVVQEVRIQKSEGYHYNQPSVAFEEQPVLIKHEYKPAAVEIEQAAAFQEIKHESEGYHYNTPAVAFEEKPFIQIQPAVTYQEIKHNVQPIQQIVHTPSVAYQEIKHEKTEGYHYEKPTVVFEEKPKVQIQPAVAYQEIKHNIQPAVHVPSVAYHEIKHEKSEGYHYEKPAVIFEEEHKVQIQPAVTYQEIKHNIQPVVHTPAVAYHEVKQEGYHYEKPAVASVVHTYQKPAIVEHVQPVTTGYHYEKPTVVFEEKPNVHTYVHQKQAEHKEHHAAVAYQEVKHEGYHYDKPAVAFEENPVVHVQQQTFHEIKPAVTTYQEYKPAVTTYVQQKQAEQHAVTHQEGYHYKKPAVTFEENPVVHVQQQNYQEIKPAVSTYQEYKPAVQTYQEIKPAVTTYQEYKPAVIVHKTKPVAPTVTYQEVKPAVAYQEINLHQQEGYRYEQPDIKFEEEKHVQVEGYRYEKPVVPFEEVRHKPAVTYQQVTHQVQPAVTFQQVYEQKPTYKDVITKTSKPAVISSFSIHQTAQEYLPVQPTQTYLPVQPVNTYIPAAKPVVKETYLPVAKPTLEYLPAPKPTPSYIPVVKPVDTYLPVKQDAVVESYFHNNHEVNVKHETVKSVDTYLPVEPVDTYLPVKPVDTYLPVKPVDTYLPVQPVGTYIPVKQDAVVESYFHNNHEVNVKHDYKPAVSIDYTDEVSEEPIVAKKSFLTYQKESGYEYPKPEIKFEEVPKLQELNFYSYDSRLGQKEEHKQVVTEGAIIEDVQVPVTSKPIVRYEFSSLDEQYNNYQDYEIQKEVKPVETYLPVTTRRPVVTTPRREYLPVTTPKHLYLPVTTPKQVYIPVTAPVQTYLPVTPKRVYLPAPTLKRVYLPVTTTETYVEVASPNNEYLPVTQEIYKIKTPKRVTTAAPSREYLPVTTARPSKEYLPVKTEKPNREYLPIREKARRTTTQKPSREYLPVTTVQPSREYLPVTSREYLPARGSKTYEDYQVQDVRRPKVKVTKSKSIVKVNDFHPILSTKLGAQCTCVSNTLTLRKKPKALNVERENYPVGYEADKPNYPAGYDIENANYPDGYVVDSDKYDYNDEPVSPEDAVDVVVEDFKYNPERITVSTTEAVYIEEPASEAIDIFVKKGRKQSVRIIKTKKPTKEEIVDAVDTGLKLVKTAVKEGVREGVKEALESKDFDRYGPGGVRGRSETLQGTVDCQRAGLFRHPKQCNKFYACRWDCDKKKFTLHVFNCPVHLTFDNNLGACNWPSQGPACVDDTLLPSV